ncbi:phytanoyl-CoA dioxygenase [Mycobacterium gordonae]|uniref:Phytanoyl-CoA dioxygenase n=1 Tax=Mycobacterium gordonae TaxID=1778 RepID=A0A0Q2QM60_MYCGO|nr:MULTISPECIES: phytanoyl-CoA dioxygenase family protein [Mycobacterium]KQH80909.1 phytanoyl-CoA dioxygenase [Mycobacterium gordonae]MDP7728605.1 phytanoyl-CoA dioxygenase family protein [Mycobacterium sp. TY813]
MVDQAILETFERDGLAVVPQVVTPAEVALLRAELEAAIAEDAVDYPDVFDRGMVHNCMVRGERMAALLDNPAMNEYLAAVLSETCIVYAYQSSSLVPQQGNYGSRVHVDSPRHIPGYSTNMGVIIALDDFTEENGATYYWKGSHRFESLPEEEAFYANASRALCKAGDMVIFHGRLVHAAGRNTTTRTRHSLTINACRSYMRQRFDFPRLVPQSIIDSLGENGKRLLGMNVRMPTSLDEFYLPEEQRLYKPNQG